MAVLFPCWLPCLRGDEIEPLDMMLLLVKTSLSLGHRMAVVVLHLFMHRLKYPSLGLVLVYGQIFLPCLSIPLSNTPDCSLGSPEQYSPTCKPSVSNLLVLGCALTSRSTPGWAREAVHGNPPSHLLLPRLHSSNTSQQESLASWVSKWATWITEALFK